MYMKKIVYLIVLMLVVSLTYAQDKPKDNGKQDLSKVSQAKGHHAHSSNLVFVMQVGENNVSSVVQDGVGSNVSIAQMGADNMTRISQNGNGNHAQSHILGFNNKVDLSQRGRDNYISEQTFGWSNAIAVDQRGKGNSVSLQTPGANYDISIEQRGKNNSVKGYHLAYDLDPQQTTVIQKGNGHEATYVQYFGAKGVKIEQKGNAAKVKVEQGHGVHINMK